MNWEQYNAEKQKKRQENYDQAMKTLKEAVEFARVNGFVLEQHSHWHFSLTYIKDGERQWRLNLYPSNQRMWADRKCGKAPFLKVSATWTFLDVVAAAIIQIHPTPRKLIEAMGG